MTLTPHVVRVLDLTEDDLRPFRVGDNTTAPTALPPPLPLPVPTAPIDKEPPAPAQPPSQLPNATPILPPAPQPPVR